MKQVHTQGELAARKILLAVTGLTPQVVTETLYALACRDEAPWIPDEIHLITTATGAENARLNLLAGQGWFHRLRADYRLPPIAFTDDHIHILREAGGPTLDDIRTPEQNTLAADFITDTVRRLSASPDTELHVSIAGGRKTMGYYLGYALSLCGRPQDRLSHVLVSDPFETNHDLYYPTPYDHPIHSERGGKVLTVNARKARVDLADIPFVRLREELPERLRSGQASFSRIVSIANRSLEAPQLRLNVPQCHAWADDECLDLTATEFLLLLWLAQRILRDEAATDWSAPDMADEFLAVAAPAGRCFYAVFTRFGRHGDIGVHHGNPFKTPVLLAITGAAITPSSYLGAHFTGWGLCGKDADGGGVLSKAIPATVHQGYATVVVIKVLI